MTEWAGRRLWDRRGAAAVLFAAAAVVVAGLLGLGTEVGAWYVMKRNQQNAVDAAAAAAAIQLMRDGTPGDCSSYSTAAQNSGVAVATQNGYTSGGHVTVTLQSPPPAGQAGAGDACAAYANIASTVPTIFAGLVLGGSMTVNATAVAKITSYKPICALAFTQLSFNGTTTLSGNCAVESNSTASDAIRVSGGSGSFGAGILLTPGGCSGSCPGPSVLSTNALPGTNVYTAIYDQGTGVAGLSFSTMTSPANCVSNSFTGNVTNVTTNNWLPTTSAASPLPPSWTSSSTKMAYCGRTNNNNTTLKTTNSDTLYLAPGTYIFWNIGINWNGGTISCSGCNATNGVTIILTGSSGSNIGQLLIGAQATVTLSAPSTNAMNAALNGVLFYVDYRASDPSNGNSEVQMSAGSASTLSGGMYFPGVSVDFSGNSTTRSHCTSLVADNINLSGTTNLDVSACPGSIRAQINVLKLLQ